MFETRIWQTLRRFTAERVVFVESESTKVGNLRVPEKLMEKIRASSCVSLNTATNLRVDLLMEDYEHFVIDPKLLGQQLQHLVSLHGHEKINCWQEMASRGEMQPLVHELLVQHYDPPYLRSIQRNWPRLEAGPGIALTDISEDSFKEAASVLINNETVMADTGANTKPV